MKKRNRKYTKVLSVITAAAMVISTTGIVSYAAESNQDIAKDNSDIKEKITEKVSSMIQENRTVGKEETVYVIAGTDGSVQKVIVSDWLKNTEETSKLSDYTELKNVQNVKGEETYSVNPKNQYVWDAKGSDIYYQGTIDKKLPVDVSISYILDGKPITGKELAGKSGKVTIRFDYKNNQQQTVKVDGKEETVKVPFMMITGMILDNKSFSNIQISNGKIVNDGERCVAIGVALPGMQENLQIEKENFEFPSYIEVTADVKDFKLATTFTVATNDIFSTLNLEEVDSLDGLRDSLKKLTDASNQLADGSNTLYEGLSQLLEKSNELTSGIDKLYEGTKQLSDGSSSLKSGANELKTGLDTLHGGLNTLVSNNDKLNGGAKQVFESLLSTADNQLAAAGLSIPKLTIDNYKATLTEVLQSLDGKKIKKQANDTALETVTQAVQEQEEVIRTQVTKAIREKVLEGVLAAAGQPMSADEYANAVAAGLIPEEMQSQIHAAVEEQMKTQEIQSKIDTTTQDKMQELIDTNMKADEVQDQIKDAVGQAAAGSGSISNLIAQLDSYNEFYQGLLSYTAGVKEADAGAEKLAEGAGQLSSGTASLQSGAGSLYDGISALKSGSAALIDGVSQLKDGSKKLSDGMKDFNEEGVQKLIDAVDGDLDGLLTHMKATTDASKEYKSFAGISDDMDGSVKFIYKTEAIE